MKASRPSVGGMLALCGTRSYDSTINILLTACGEFPLETARKRAFVAIDSDHRFEIFDARIAWARCAVGRMEAARPAHPPRRSLNDDSDRWRGVHDEAQMPFSSRRMP